MKNDDGTTTIKLEINASEVFTPEFRQLVKDELVGLANKKIGEGNKDFSPEELTDDAACILSPIIEHALTRVMAAALVEMANDPEETYEGVFGKDPEEDESKHE